jgi:nitrous oxidase accessory protein
MAARNRVLRGAAVMVLLLSAAWPFLPAKADAQQPARLQELIDRVEAGQTVRVPAGEYEGPAVIDKPLRLLAEGDVRLVHRGPQPALHITADDVEVRGLAVDDRERRDAGTVLVEADRVRLADLAIRSASRAVRLVGADDGEILDSAIEWAGGNVPVSRRGNGIDLFASHRNRIAGNTIAGMHDGIYVESGDGNAVENNRVDRSRYGIHLMYTGGTIVRGNAGAQNITGIMAMTSQDLEVTGNTLIKQHENVHSQGILLFDVSDSLFAENTVEGNRVGFYVEESRGNRIVANEIRQNYIGVQMISANGNLLERNVFAGNVADAEAVDSGGNEVRENHWDAFLGLDADGDGRSDLPNPVNPFFLKLTESVPAFQLFFRSPGMVFLEGLYASGRDGWLLDAAPLMEPPETDGDAPEARRPSDAAAGALGLALLAAAIINIWYWGLRRS